MKTHVAIIGAGPAGLTAAYLLAKNNVDVTVLEADPVYVGGISRTATYKGFHFDIGGHRFFSKSKEVNDFWKEILPNDMLDRPRSSRIFYGGKFFAYPLKAFEALTKLGVIQSTLCVLSWRRRGSSRCKNPTNFEDWVSNQFGKRLFNTFFKSYTEKVWGMPCKEISADWAAQRIKGLSLGSAIKNALFPKKQPKESRSGHQDPDQFLQVSAQRSRHDVGGMRAQRPRRSAAKSRWAAKSWGCDYDAEISTWNVQFKDQQGNVQSLEAEHVISSAPMRELVNGLKPPVSERAKHAANSLKYRDFLTVMLILKNRDAFEDNWIYIHDPKVKVGRIQNFRSWSPEMVPDRTRPATASSISASSTTASGIPPTNDLIKLAEKELRQIGLAKEGDVSTALSSARRRRIRFTMTITRTT